MPASPISRLALLTALAALVASVSTAPSASAATQRYASPGGAGDCSSASPCSITQAIKGADTGDEVIVAPGDYPLTATITNSSTGITIHGISGQPRPRLMFSGANQAGVSLTDAAMLRYVEIDQATPWTYALWTQKTKVDQTIVKGAGASCTAAVRDSTITNSVFIAPGMNVGATLCTAVNASTATSTYRNVTAIASGAGGVAIEASAVGGAASNASIYAVNVIAYTMNGGTDLKARTDGSGAQAAITVTHSNYDSQLKVGTNTAIATGGGNQAAFPKFVNVAAGDYRQAAGSATIDAGLDAFTNGAFDVDGDPRYIGTTDIGADEFFVAPDATTGPAGEVTGQSATLTGSVNANGVPTSYWFEYGPTTAYGSSTPATDAGSGGGVAATAALVGLSPATTYHYRLVAANSGVVRHGADQTFTTVAQPSAASSAPPSPTSTTAPSVPAFAGVRLVSTRLSFGGRFITVRLSCPAGTVGRCSGATKLTARRRTSSGAASSVVLGRARFSIAAGKQARVRVRVARAGRRLLRRVRRLRAKDTNAARDGAGRSKTTVARVTIRRHTR